jgi:hypothetical protein
LADVTEALFDLIGVLFALGLSGYAFTLLRVFRGGINETSFKILAVTPLLFAIAELVDALNALDFVRDPSSIIHSSFEILFIIGLFAGFYKLSKAWRIEKR